MMSLSLRAERAKLIEDARAIIDVENPTSEDNAKFDQMLDHAEIIKAQIDRIEKAARLEAEMGEVIGASAERNRVSV